MSFLRIQFIEDAVLSLLKFLADTLGNYGLAIIATTIIVKCLLYPLAVKQEKSMFKMKLIQPKIDELNKKYKDDKATLQKKTAELYRENQVNPLGGCLPILIQLPIFMALYFAFTSDSAIPNTAKFLWFNLSSPDNLFNIGSFSVNLLPLLSGLLMFMQQKLTMGKKDKDGSSTENSMQTAMMAMPIMMTVLFYNFPAGVNLYYVLNSIITVLQQKYIQSKLKKQYENK